MNSPASSAPLTGWGAYWAEGYQKGVLMASDEINTSDKKIEITIEDGATEGVKSATAAQKLINIDKVDGLIVEFTAPSSAVSPIALQNNIPLLYDAVTKKIVESNPFAFKMYFDMEKQCYVAAKNLAKNGAKHIGGLIMNLDFAEECQRAMDKVAEENGIRVSYYLFPTETVDFKTHIAKMKTDGVDALVPVAFEDGAIAFFKQKTDLGFRVPVFLGLGVPDSFSVEVRSSVATSSLEGVMTYDQKIPTKFLNDVKKKYPNLTESNFLSAAFGYDETTRLYRALSSCGRKDNECIKTTLTRDTYPGALTDKGFNADRVINLDPIYYRYTNGQLVEFTP
jgi:branched-chain amino acid transport system substrate-binding protein